MRIQLITKDNGVGLSHDVRVLRHAIARAYPDAEVAFVDWRSPKDGRASDVNIFLELLAREFTAMAPINIFVPNPEWYYSHLWGAILPRMSHVWAKTEDCLRIFKGLHSRTVLSGWTSEDRLDPSVIPSRRMLHVAGASTAKGTTQVIAAMRALPDLRLTIVAREDRWQGTLPPNIELLLNVPDDALRALQNECMVHLCPSSYEGFGHYINEARSVGAFIITTNASPMREMVALNGACVGYDSTGMQNLATHKHVSADALRSVIAAVMDAPTATLATVASRGREAYEAERDAFHLFIRDALRP